MGQPTDPSTPEEEIDWITMRQAVDPRNRRLHRPMPTRDVPWVPTDEQVARTMLRFAHVTADDVVYDLGCGDGRIVLLAAKHFGARGVGVDIDPQRVVECRENARRMRLSDRVTFLLDTLFEVEIEPATVVVLYLLPKINVQLRPRLLWELRPGTRIICNNFGMGDWEPDEQVVVQQGSRPLMKWIVPAWVQGRWKAAVHAGGKRRHFRMVLGRRYQFVDGTALVAGKSVQVQEGRLRGRSLTFRLPWSGPQTPALVVEAEVGDDALRGHWRAEADDRERGLFYALRERA